MDRHQNINKILVMIIINIISSNKFFDYRRIWILWLSDEVIEWVAEKK